MIRRGQQVKKRRPELWDEAMLRERLPIAGSVKALARQLGCTHATLGRIVDVLGIERPAHPKARQYTMAMRTHACCLYDAGLSLREIARAIGSVNAATVENWVRDSGRMLRSSGMQHRIRCNDHRTGRGRWRIDMIREVVRLHAHEGLGRRRIARRLGLGEGTVQKMLATASADALRRFAFTNRGGSIRAAAAAMRDQGCDERTIARTLGIIDHREAA